jgi:CRISPR system Cascade subunit CasA
VSYSFNLLDRPWIPCQDAQGAVSPSSIRNTLARAHQFRAITHESPLVGVSVLRLLLAILHRVYGPRDPAAWAALWTAPSFDMVPLDSYFQKWSARFDLFHPNRPFYQDASIPASVAVPVSKLVHSSASGNNPTLFDHSFDADGATLPAPEAALQLLVQQVFAVGGLVTEDRSIPGSKSAEAAPTLKAILCAVAGHNLFETLLLNLRRYDPLREIPFGNSGDIPAWESSHPAQVRQRPPAGWLDLLTWQSRRILLCPAGDSDAPVVTRVVVMKGEHILPAFSLAGRDSMIGWHRLADPRPGADPWIPVSIREGKAIWRDAHTLFGEFAEHSSRPPILNWLGELADVVLQEDRRYVLDVAGLCSDRAKLFSWHAEHLPLPASFLTRPALCAQIQLAIEHAEGGETTLRKAAYSLAAHLLVPFDQGTEQSRKGCPCPPGSFAPSPPPLLGCASGTVLCLSHRSCATRIRCPQPGYRH